MVDKVIKIWESVINTRFGCAIIHPVCFCSREVHRKPRMQHAQLLILVLHLGAPILHYSAPQTYNFSTLKLQLSSV